MKTSFIARVLALGSLIGFASAVPAPADDGGGVRYDGHKVIRTVVANERQLQTLLQISPDVWSESIGLGVMDFRIPPDRMDELDASGIKYQVLIDDVQPLIDAQNRGGRNLNPGGGWFTQYKSYDAIMDYVDTLAAVNPDITETFEVGQSIEGRAIRGIRIRGREGRPAIFIQGCQHAREWVSPMVVMFIADHLVRGYGSDDEVTRLLNQVEFIIVPVVNPDGYHYTRPEGGNVRLWRKNRRNNGGGSFGVDLNRNWGWGWGGAGSSGNPFSQIYRGTGPFSEPESAAMRDFIQANPRIVRHLDIHSYSQLILWPWGNSQESPPDESTFRELGFAMRDAILAVHGTVYRPGQITRILYFASGNSTDWVYGETDTIAFAYELRDTGRFGFLLPPEQIIPNGEEIIPAMLLLADALAPHTTLVDLQMLFGTLISGDMEALADSDGVYLRTRSQFGFRIDEANVTELLLTFETTTDGPEIMGATVESRINNPVGVGQIRLKNYNDGGRFDLVGEFPLGRTESVESVEGIAAADYVNAEGQVEMKLKNVVVATFSLDGFVTRFDQVVVEVE